MSDINQKPTGINRQAETAADNVEIKNENPDESMLAVDDGPLDRDCSQTGHNVYDSEFDVINHEVCSDSSGVELQSGCRDTPATTRSGVRRPLASDEKVDMQAGQPPEHPGMHKKRRVSSSILESNNTQIKYLYQYMAKHPELAKTPISASDVNVGWANLKKALDTLGQHRSVYQWKICWRDLKRKARDELRALQSEAKPGAGGAAAGAAAEAPRGSRAPGTQEAAAGCGPDGAPTGWSPAPRPALSARRRARSARPPDRFLNAQLELNHLMRELIKEVRRGNDLIIKEVHDLKEEFFNKVCAARGSASTSTSSGDAQRSVEHDHAYSTNIGSRLESDDGDGERLTRRKGGSPTEQCRAGGSFSEQCRAGGSPSEQCRVGGSPSEQCRTGGSPSEQCRAGGSFSEQCGAGGSPFEQCRAGGSPSEQCRAGGSPSEQCRAGGSPSEQCRAGGSPSEQCRAGGSPSEQCRAGGSPSEQCRAGGSPSEQCRAGGSFSEQCGAGGSPFEQCRADGSPSEQCRAGGSPSEQCRAGGSFSEQCGAGGSPFEQCRAGGSPTGQCLASAPAAAAANVSVETLQGYDFQWTTLPDPPIPPEWRRETFLNSSVGPTTACADPYEAFSAIWDYRMMEHIASETNRYAQELSDRDLRPDGAIRSWRDTTVDELYVYFALLLGLGYVVRVVRDSAPDTFYWPGFDGHMSFPRFQLLSKCLHFNNNEVIRDLNLDVSETKLFKIQPVVEHLNDKFQQLYNLSQNIVIDESLLQRSSSQAPGGLRRTRTTGIESYELCEAQSGYVWRFVIQKGSRARTPTEEFASAIVLGLIRGLEHRGHTLFMERFFNSPALARKLKGLGFDCVGTLRTDRRHVPASLQVSADMWEGELRARTAGDVDALLWCEPRRVALLSTYHGAALADLDDVTSPAAFVDYQNVMRSLDERDLTLNASPFEKTLPKGGYKKLFRKLLNVSAWNANILCQSSGLDHKTFRGSLVESILEKHSKYVP